MKFNFKKLNYFAMYQTSYKGSLDTKYQTEYFDEFNKEGNYKCLRIQYHNDYNKTLSNNFTIIAFIDEKLRDEKDEDNKKYKDAVYYFLHEKAVLHGAKKVRFYYAYYPYAELFHIYKKTKRSNHLYTSFGIDLVDPRERKDIRLRQSYFEFLNEVFKELNNGDRKFRRSELEKEYINICTINNVRNDFNLQRDKVTELRDSRDYHLNVAQNKLTASQKYTEKDFERYIELYYNEAGYSWKQAFYLLQKETTNEYIKKLEQYNSFDTSFKLVHPEYKKKSKTPVKPPL